MSMRSRTGRELEVTPIGGALGAEVRGMDLGRADHEIVAAIGELLAEHLVVFFPDQDLSVAAHLRLGQAFGEVVSTTYIPIVDPAYPGVSLHRSEDGYVANVWHSDGQNRSAPVKLTVMHMQTCPRRGGDTMWANQYAVYEALSAPLRELVDGLTALQRSGVNPSEQATHPAVVTHPGTGRKLLYVSKHHTVRFLELSLAESRALIEYLVELSVQPELVCRYRWTPNAVGIWDNLATQHYGVADFDEPRVFHRVMVAGPELPARAGRWPAVDDGRPRTVVVQDGGDAVIGQMSEQLWSH